MLLVDVHMFHRGRLKILLVVIVHCFAFLCIIQRRNVELRLNGVVQRGLVTHVRRIERDILGPTGEKRLKHVGQIANTSVISPREEIDVEKE